VTTARRTGWVDRRWPEPEDRRVTIGDGSSFLAGAPRWVDGLGRLRDVVRQRLIAAQLSQVMTTRVSPARVLDVGCGQGTQALFLGPDRAVNLIEVGVLGTDEGPLIIHAMVARAGRFRASKE